MNYSTPMEEYSSASVKMQFSENLCSPDAKQRLVYAKVNQPHVTRKDGVVLILRDTHSTNGKSVIAVVAFVPVHVPRNKVQDVSVAGVVHAESARPIEAIRTRF